MVSGQSLSRGRRYVILRHDLLPSFLASSSTFRVTGGGVMMDTEVSLGSGSSDRDLTVGISAGLPAASGRDGTAMEGAAGLIGMAWMSWWRYQAKT